jgi:hypothetical protein
MDDVAKQTNEIATERKKMMQIVWTIMVGFWQIVWKV